MEKKYTGINLNLFIFMIFTIINLTPYLGRVTPIIINILLVILWILTAFFSDYLYFTKFNKVRLFTTAWIFCLVIMQLIGFADNAVGNLFYYLIFWFSIIVYDFYSSHLNSKQNIFLVTGILITMTINIFINIYELIQYPQLSKLITGSVLAPELGVNSNVGVYSYALIVSIIMIAFITLFLESKSKPKKLFYLFISISCFYMVILASSMIGILASMIMLIVYAYIYITKNSQNKKTMFFIILFISILFVLFVKDNIYDFSIKFARNMDNMYLQERFLNIIHAIYGINDQVSFSGRESLYLDSMVTFLKNPLIGVGRRHIGVDGIIGLHSQILDDAAYFGVFGIIIQLLIFNSYYKAHLQRYMDSSIILKSFTVSIIFGSIFFAFFNPFINGYSGLMIFIFVPLFCDVLMTKKLGIKNRI